MVLRHSWISMLPLCDKKTSIQRKIKRPVANIFLPKNTEAYRNECVLKTLCYAPHPGVQDPCTVKSQTDAYKTNAFL